VLIDRRRSIAIAIAVLATAPATVSAQGNLLVQGIGDAEFWASDTMSNLLTRNAGRPSGLARLQLWAAAEPWRGLVVYAQGQALVGSAKPAMEIFQAVALQQLGVRYSWASWFMLDAGKTSPIVGEFAARRFSDRNPLIGVPDAYPTQYPVGVKVSGSTKVLDYRAAIVSIPVSHPVYVPNPDAAARPALGLGITPFVGFRVAASTTWGPYLNQSFSASQLDGRAWTSFHQRVAAFDVSFSRGYLETYAELGLSSYDVPRRAEPIQGTAYFVEAKYTVRPRLFFAGRFERNDYPFIAAFGPTTWVSSSTAFNNGEIGAGLRLSASTLLKMTCRADRWHLTPENEAFIRPGGRVFAIQLSQSYDVLDWVDRVRMR
jgi:hypothetical protein